MGGLLQEASRGAGGGSGSREEAKYAGEMNSYAGLDGVINQGIDAWLHVNPGGEEKGLAMVFNPTGNILILWVD